MQPESARPLTHRAGANRLRRHPSSRPFALPPITSLFTFAAQSRRVRVTFPLLVFLAERRPEIGNSVYSQRLLHRVNRKNVRQQRSVRYHLGHTASYAFSRFLLMNLVPGPVGITGMPIRFSTKSRSAATQSFTRAGSSFRASLASCCNVMYSRSSSGL